MSQRRGGRYGGPPPLPKPYKFVELPSGPIERRMPAGHALYEEGTVSGTLKGEIVAISPIHVASGQIKRSGRKDISLVKAHIRSKARPVIPGSSLKGSIRSIVEAISPSCVHITRARYNQQPFEVRACRDNKRLCVACRMFGALGYQGLVRFSDAVLQEGYTTEIVSVPSLYSPRTRQRLYLNERGQVKGRKFYLHGKLAPGDVPIEVCPGNLADPAGSSRFDFTVYFDNLTPAELGLLLLALGQGTPKLYPKLGGGKPVCCGSIEISIEALEIAEAPEQAYTNYDLHIESVGLDEYLTAAQEIVLEPQLEQLADILRLDAERQCPERNY